ncbi:MAG: leucine-rich repeat protein [Eubacterium sp.]
MKKFMTIILSLSLFAVLFCTAFPAYALNQEEDIERTQILTSDTYYSFNAETKTLTISGNGEVPDFSNSSGATNSQPWITWRSDGSIEHVVIEEGITSLGSYCLYNVNKADISLPTTLKTLGSYSMAGTDSNTEVRLPENLETISANAFYYTTGLKSIYIPKAVKTIGRSAFENCASLESVTFGSFNMEVSIDRRAFLKCAALKSVTIPKRATLADYSFGYYSASSGSVYSDFIMQVYRDSTAYDYAVSKVVPYELVNSGVIFEGDSVDCTYYDDSVSSVMTFVFTPAVTAKYCFFSEGSMDVACEMTDSAGNVIATAEDNSSYDANFTLIEAMSAGQTYYLNVSSNNYTGVFSVSLLPYTVANIDVDIEPISVSANDRSNGLFDIEQYFEGKTVTITYDTGYTDTAVYTSGVIYRFWEIKYNDDQSDAKWQCGNHMCSISLDEANYYVDVEIAHSYDSKIIEPTYQEKGYTIYTCSLCKDTYYTDYVNSIGVKVTGRIVLMQDTDGSHKDNIPVPNTKIGISGNEIYTVADDGTFLFYIDADTKQLDIYETYGLTRTVDVIPDSDNELNLGDVAFFHFDYNGDGYVNAKDYAIIHTVYGVYPKVEKDMYFSRDYNQDGKIDDSDWFDVGADNFYLCGKITDVIYD